MDENTTAEQLHHRAAPRSNGPLGRRRRTLAAAALLLSLAATVSACNSDGSTKNTAASSSAGSSATGSPSSSAGASPSPSGSAGTSATPAPGSAQPSAPAGGGTSSAPIKPAPSSPAPGQSQPTAPSGATPPATTPLPVDPQAQLKPANYLTKGNQLTVFFFGGVCDKYGLKADESKAGQVTVQVVITQKPPAGQICPDLVKQQSVTTDLAQPLQGRKVVSATGADVPLESVPNGGPVSAGN
ncbi:hypothetical protein ACFZB9_01700 [Kitasatospora sp. NPDC008050]|uniref:hypothetical protein n=1 Tax=Kitasatospora sp. NPDC008050 TaxID=3364021 RepID=UPI0036E49EA0